jgi:1-acyl-sn-glycerol-3-phosphate acyltransferase/nucleoside-diphosphate-sugar epimerase
MSDVVLLAAPTALATRLLPVLQSVEGPGEVHRITPEALASGQLPATKARIVAGVYVPTLAAAPQVGPSADEAYAALRSLFSSGAEQVVLVSSAEIYGASPRNPGFLDETRVNVVRAQRATISAAWLELETLAQQLAVEHASVKLKILRACPTLVRGSQDYFSRLLLGRLAVTLAGHDPSLQLLSPDDLGRAIVCALTHAKAGVWNIAPDSVIPIRAALELCRAVRVAVPRELQLHPRRWLSALGLAEPVERLDYIRYSFTIGTRKAKQELGFVPTRGSAEALMEFLGDSFVPAGTAAPSGENARSYDDFGMDKDYLAARSRGLFEFLARYYWRIEVEGLEHVPKSGAGILAGLHRGLVAWDGVMILHLLSQRMNRYPRFLVHPTGFQFPFVFDFTTKLGGIVACQENADYVLEHDELLGIFPEGIRGVFSLYREAYQLRKFGRHDFVKIALRHGVPIVPFVIVGSAESYPIVAKFDWSWWTRKTEWPYFPITPTLFPLIPAPLPAKWHVRFLPPLDVAAEHGPEAARDPAIVRALSDRVKRQMEEAIADVTQRRKSIFFG